MADNGLGQVKASGVLEDVTQVCRDEVLSFCDCLRDVLVYLDTGLEILAAGCASLL